MLITSKIIKVDKIKMHHEKGLFWIKTYLKMDIKSDEILVFVKHIKYKNRGFFRKTNEQKGWISIFNY